MWINARDQISNHAAETCNETGRPHRKARSYRSLSMGQQTALAMRERMISINVKVLPSPVLPGAIHIYGDPPNTVPTIRTDPDVAEAERADALLDLKAFTDSLRTSRGRGVQAFVPARQGLWRPTLVGNAMLPVIGTLYGLSLSPRVSRQLEPYARRAHEVYQEAGLHELVQQRVLPAAQQWGYGPWDTVAVNLCNMFVLQLSACINDNKAGRQEIAHKALHQKRSHELREYLSGIPKRHPRARIIRLELSKVGVSWVPEREDWVAKIKASTQVLTELKLRYGEAIVADVRKLDVDPTGRFVVHLLLAIDGPTDSELKELIRVALELWDSQHPNCGAVVVCDDFDAFLYRGTGSMVRPYESLAGQLDKAVVYLAETDRWIHYSFGANDDGLLFGKVSGPPMRPA